MEYLIVYLILINGLSFYCLRSDKKRAGFSRYRIGQRTFFILSLLGGGIGVLIGMNYYKYLKDKTSFRIGIPCILAVQMILFLLILFGG